MIGLPPGGVERTRLLLDALCSPLPFPYLRDLVALTLGIDYARDPNAVSAHLTELSEARDDDADAEVRAVRPD